MRPLTSPSASGITSPQMLCESILHKARGRCKASWLGLEFALLFGDWLFAWFFSMGIGL